MEVTFSFQQKQRMKLSQKRVLSLELPVTSLIFRLSVKAAPDSSESAQTCRDQSSQNRASF